MLLKCSFKLTGLILISYVTTFKNIFTLSSISSDNIYVIKINNAGEGKYCQFGSTQFDVSIIALSHF